MKLPAGKGIIIAAGAFVLSIGIWSGAAVLTERGKSVRRDLAPAVPAAPVESLGNSPVTSGGDSSAVYFPIQARIRYARGFTLRYFRNYKVLDLINPWGNRQDTVRFVLVPRGQPRPGGFAQAQFVEIPIRSLVCLSTSHLALADMLDANARIVGVSDTQYVANPEILARIRSGKIIPVGDGNAISVEKVLALRPDLIMSVGRGEAQAAAYAPLREAGIPVLANSEWLETTPLARTEWVKALAAFLDEEGKAETKFAALENRYLAIRDKAARFSAKPKVLCGMDYQGTWYLPGGKSYLAALVADAGGDYLWKGDSSVGALAKNFESVYAQAKDADFWIEPGDAKTAAEVAALDERFAMLAPFRSGRIFNNNKRRNAHGGNDYYESGLAHPDQVLADLAQILHPELAGGRALAYYRALP